MILKAPAAIERGQWSDAMLRKAPIILWLIAAAMWLAILILISMIPTRF